MSKTIFLGFGHRKRVGKDCAARFLVSYLRLHKQKSNIQIKGFADKGKAVCHDLYGWAGLKNSQHYEDHPEEREIIIPELNKTPRQIWIDFMSRAVRDQVYDKTWVNYLLHNTNCDVCVIKDMRFPIEADMIQDMGGYVYRIDRNDAPNDSDMADDALLDYDRWNGIINNNGTLQEFNKQIEQLGQNLLLQMKGIQ